MSRKQAKPLAKNDRSARAVAYSDSRIPLWQAFLRGDKKATKKLFDDMAKEPRIHARIIGLEQMPQD